MKGRGKEREVLYPLFHALKCSPELGLGQVETRSLELGSGLPCRWPGLELVPEWCACVAGDGSPIVPPCQPVLFGRRTFGRWQIPPAHSTQIPSLEILTLKNEISMLSL